MKWRRPHINAVEGLAGLSLDAITSVGYGPQAMLVVLAAGGTGALGALWPITLVIVALLVILVVSYSQVIAAYPDGGGAYTVASANLGRLSGQVAGASLIVDYVLTAAVSLTSGVAALVSAFPPLASDSLWLTLAILGFLTVINLRGIAASSRSFLIPTGVFVIGTYLVIAIGFARSVPASGAALPAVTLPHTAGTIGLLLALKAFAAGCTGLTGVEAIANDVPAFEEPRARRAQHTEVLLGLILGSMLLGLAVLTARFHIAPSPHQTVLSQVTAASVGRGGLYYVVDLATTVLLCLAANTSFGGLPVLASRLARDGLAPARFARQGNRPVYRWGVVSLAASTAILLIAVDADTNTLIPLFAIGVFTGFTLSQAGLVRHWASTRPRQWRRRATLNAVGAAMTAVATAIFVVTKFTAGAWVVIVVIPALIALFRVHRRTRTALPVSEP